MKFRNTITSSTVITGLSLSLIGLSNAAITVHGSSSAFTEVGNDWLTMGTNDIDSNGGLATDGYIFPGLYDGVSASNNDSMFTTTAVLPSYVSNVVTGADVIGTTYNNNTYGVIDNPTTADGTDHFGGFWIATGGVAGDAREMINFDVGTLAAGQTVRVGIFAGLQGATNGRWDPTSINLTDGTASATVGTHGTSSLIQNPGGSHIGNGWTFFDIDAAGTYTINATKRLDTQGAGISGLTFDSIIVPIPEPSTGILVGLSGLALTLRRRRNA